MAMLRNQGTDEKRLSSIAMCLGWYDISMLYLSQGNGTTSISIAVFIGVCFSRTDTALKDIMEQGLCLLLTHTYQKCLVT